MDTVEKLNAALSERYAIERELGQGGMATVYLAEDLRHHRKVALKVLRPEIAATLGADRFAREIEVAARLQHPNILPLLDSGEAAGFFFYVMPFIEGESLRDRLARSGEFAIPDAVRVLVEVADALSHAHAHGVVHRDIKPGNVLLSGRHALVADFGVAKAVTEATGHQVLTSAGIALGTPAYMAPEQAVADPHQDHRVDIYALGVLGYELLTGRRPFSATTAQEMLTAHVTADPEPLEQYRPTVSPELAQVVLKCLAKKPADRWQTADELLTHLEPLATPSGGTTPTQTRPMSALAQLPRWVKWAAGVAALAAIAAVLFLPARRGPTIILGKRVAVAAGPELETWPSLSADGKLVTYTRRRGTISEQVVQQVDGGAPVALTQHLPGAHGYGALSPDGGRVLMWASQGLQTTPILGGQLRTVAGGTGWSKGWGAWSPDGNRIAYVAYTGMDTLFTQALGGSARIAVATGRELHSPAWSPDGEWIAYVEGNYQFHMTGNLAPSALRVVRAAGGRPVHVTENGSLNTSPVWVPGRRALLFISDREGGRDIYELYLKRSGEPAGAPVRITTGLNPERLAISADRRRLAWSAYTESGNVWSLEVPPRDSIRVTTARPVTTGSQEVETAAVSQDGRWLYYESDRSGNMEVWRQPLTGGSPEQLTTDAAADFSPQASPDGREVAFHSLRTGNREIFVIKAEGGGEVRVSTSREENYNPTWSPDGQSLLWAQPNHADSVIWTSHRSADGSWGPARLVAPASGSFLARYSPDGRWIALVGGGLKLLEVGTGNVRLVDSQGTWAAWAEDGKTLYFATVLDSTGHFTIKSATPAGGTPRTLAYGNDPVSQSRRTGFAVHGGRFYFPLIERKSDIWVADIRER